MRAALKRDWRCATARVPDGAATHPAAPPARGIRSRVRLRLIATAGVALFAVAAGGPVGSARELGDAGSTRRAVQAERLVLDVEATITEHHPEEPSRAHVRVTGLELRPASGGTRSGSKPLEIVAYEVATFDCWTHTYRFEALEPFRVASLALSDAPTIAPRVTMLIDPGVLREVVIHRCGRDGETYSDQRLTYSDGMRELVGRRVEGWSRGPAGSDVVARKTVAREGDDYFTGRVELTLRRPRPIDDVVQAVVGVARRFVGTPDARELWRAIERQVAATTPRTSAPMPILADPLQPVYEVLYDAVTIRNLRALSQAQKAEALTRIFDRLAPSSATGAPLAAPPLGTAADAAAEARLEQPSVSARIQAFSEGGWVGVRRALLASFGVMEVGPSAAIRRANDYFALLVPSSVCGRNGGPVHPELQARLASTTRALTAAECDTFRTQIVELGGFWIRPNRNNPASLSAHSFGWAIDVNSARNPNVGRSGALELVPSVTGVDPDVSSAGAAMNYTSGRTTAEVETEAERLRNASVRYVAVMRTDESIGAEMLRFLNAARATERMPALTPAAANPILAASRQRNASAATLATRMFAQPAGSPRPGSVALRRRRAAAATLIALHRTFRSSFRGTRRVAASAIATKGSVAANGFMSLPPRLVATLSGREAGALVWLGTDRVHDFMHFELPVASRPPLFRPASPFSRLPAGA